ncbi:sensor histidine kinase [Streptomyces sp. NPDC127584]|uniref:sensor histidine kinase n=1 Tax=Streptomyces sp. NPDC127584 TaxID=3345403 RepID=UPI003634B7BA
MAIPHAPFGLRFLRVPYDWWRQRGPFAQDFLVALALTVPAFVPNSSRIGGQIGDLPQQPQNALTLVLVLAQILPAAARRRWPASTLAVAAVAFAVHQALGFPTTFASLGLYLTLYSAGAHQVRHRREAVLALSGGYAVLALVLNSLGSPRAFLDYLAFYLFLAAFWLGGRTVRKHRTQEADRRRLAAEVARATERARIARELHDVVTHHVTAMVIQADAAQFLLASAPERAGESMTHVSDTGRRALADLRHLLGVLEATGETASAGRTVEGDRSPTLGEVGDLVEQTRRSGQPVAFTEQGERRAQSLEVELAAYRVVQEALTNAVKYAAGQRTHVRLRHAGEHTEITVTTGGTPGAPTAEGSLREGGGRGLGGLHARVTMLDGRFEAGPRPEGGFEVRATLPFQPRQA